MINGQDLRNIHGANPSAFSVATVSFAYIRKNLAYVLRVDVKREGFES